ncbi:MAG: TRAP transporter small permease [Gammaproteobacteria bacterium]|nr:TRAP transporter small permease [Gammaproteobacteria bacterium]
MDRYIRLVAQISRLCGITAAAMIVISVLVVCQMVVMRYGFEASTYWQTEFVTYLLLAATFIGSPYVLLTKGHVNVELVPLYLSQRGRFYLALFAASFALLVCLVIVWSGGEIFVKSWQREWHSDSVWAVRLWIPYLAMPVGFGVMALQYVADILSLLTGREMPFGMPAEGGE